MKEETKDRIVNLLKSKGFMIVCSFDAPLLRGFAKDKENHGFIFIKKLKQNMKLQGDLDWYSLDREGVLTLSFHYQDHKLCEIYDYIRDENDVEKLIDRICKVTHDSLTEILSRLSEFMMTGM